MLDSTIDFVHGIPEEYRESAAHLYDGAFGEKFALAVRSKSSRIELLSKSFQLQFAFGAIVNEQLVGLAGYHAPSGSLTGGMNYAALVSQLGTVRGNWAALICSLYERKPMPDELVMDGIVVASSMREKGIGTRLLTNLAEFASQEGFETIRLDVIDTNPGARQLYERNEFIAISTEQFGYLRWLLGFGAATKMIRTISRVVEHSDIAKSK